MLLRRKDGTRLSIQSSVYSSKFRIPQVLCLPLLRKHPGVYPHSFHSGTQSCRPLGAEIPTGLGPFLSRRFDPAGGTLFSSPLHGSVSPDHGSRITGLGTLGCARASLPNSSPSTFNCRLSACLRGRAHGDGCDDRMAGGGSCELSPTGACAAGRSVRENNLAWTEPAASHQRCDGKASCLAPRTRATQHLGSGAAHRLLEVCGPAHNRRRPA